MQSKMISFLHSIGIAEEERYDMEFLLAGRNAYNREQIDMMIQKETLWDYALLEEFLSALSSIRYPYTIRFSYRHEVTPLDAVELYRAFLIAHPFYETHGRLSARDGVLVLALPEGMKPADESAFQEFLGLCSFIQYPTSYQVETLMEEAKAPAEPEAPREEPREEPAMEEIALSEEDAAPMEGFVPAEEAPAPMEEAAAPEAEEESADEAIEADLAKAMREGEEALLALKEKNYAAMMEERNRQRLRKIGNYKVAEHIEEIFHLGLANVDFCGEVFQADIRTTKRGGKMATFGIGDETNAITVRCFEGKSITELKMNAVKVGDRLRVRGAIDVDRFTHQKTIRAHFLDPLPPKPMRDDDPSLEQKRVELHLHTNMSAMDGIPEFSSYYRLAKHFGMKAIAVTDHGVVQSFPSAQDTARADKSDPLKIIYGCELYMFDMDQTIISNPSSQALTKARYCVFDTETTGLSARYDRLVEFGGVIVEGGAIVERMDILINPEMPMPISSSSINHITDDMLADKPTIHECLDQIMAFLGDNILVAHNATFDIGFINAALEREGREPLKNPVVDTLPLSHYLFPKAGRHTEGAMLRNLGLQIYDESDAHRAEYDASALNEGWQEIVRKLDGIYPGITHEKLGTLQVELPDIEDVERDNADEGNYARFLRAMNKFMPFYHLQYPKDAVKTSFASYEEAHEEYKRIAFDPDPLSQDLSAKPLLCQHLADVKEAFNSFCRNLREYHCVVLAKNAQGLKDLYKIVTQGHTTYLGRVPKTPRQLIEVYRKNLIVGSGCLNGEIFELASTRSQSVLVEAMRFYDYIEIQPVENYSYLVGMQRISSIERVKSLLRDIADAARLAGRPVVATGDCHYVNPEDKILRDVYIETKAIGGGSHPMNPPSRSHLPLFENPSQHFRSTHEMLDSFETWCSKEEAYEYVVVNSNRIADQIGDDIVPVSDDLFPPNENLPDSAGQLRRLCDATFHSRYDYAFDDDPKVLEAIAFVKARMDRELDGIIGHGYAVTYFIAHKLIKMANDEPEHYIVGSRGSVGSSFAATMSGITEVNALPPHYQCPHCHYLTFKDDDGVDFLQKGYKSGFDLPNKTCPKCGAMMKQNGQNIPFETFLGFTANKVPDIDLNFEDESQHKAHNYTRILLGSRNVFRAGTIATVAEKTAFGYVRGYFERLFEKEGKGRTVDDVNSTYIAYLASKCQGVKRTTGQHPGGIVVVPSNMSVYDFTAVQHPADDLHSDWLTTHYDFHSMHDEILKFDILGHVDPMAMRYYRDLTGVKIEDIPMNDPKVLSLFTSPRELHLHRDALGAITGASALPEFGTKMAQGMLHTAKPKTFNDLLIISGLSHGTDVWAGNAEKLIVDGITDINGVIGCRDDIMSYLILKGVEPSLAFDIMEATRKGRFSKKADQYIPEMRAHGVPEWYIESCEKIKYLFPRGHATAYVTMAVRVAYFKLYYPLQFYAVFFSIRSDAYDIETMIAGEDAIYAKICALRERSNDRNNPLSNKEEDQLATLLIALEMYERGYKIENLDLYRSDAKMFVVDEEHQALIPPFKVIDGLGEAAGASVVEAREALQGKPFLSKAQLLSMTKLSTTNVADLSRLHVLDDLSETNQLTLF